MPSTYLYNSKQPRKKTGKDKKRKINIKGVENREQSIEDDAKGLNEIAYEVNGKRPGKRCWG